jgi:glycosyltransferase involved in cell wall biosynthesis
VTAKGRIVAVTMNEPYPFGQANGRWCHAFLKGLSDAGWRVRCLSVSTSRDWESGARAALKHANVDLSFYPIQIKRGPSRVRAKWATLRRPFSYSLSDDLRRDLEQECRRGYDALHLEQLWSGYLADGRDRVVTSVHHLERIDLEGVWQPSWRFVTSKALMTWTERRLLGRLRHIRTTTDRLANAVRVLNPSAALHVVPNALDPSLFDFTADDRSEAPVLGFIASMNWSPGYLAAVRLIRDVFPRIRLQSPDARLLLVGWNARGALARYVNTPGVDIVENVPEARPYFHRLRVFAYPLPRGSGMMVKLLEAMAYGIPVVTTTEGIEGIAAHDGEHAFVADADDLFADRVVRLLKDAQLRRAIRVNARQLVVDRYSPRPAAAALESMYATV